MSLRSVARLIALSRSKQRHRARAVSLFVNGSTFVDQSPGSAMRLRVDGTSCHAAIIACSDVASSGYGCSEPNASSELSFAASSAPPATGGALENNVYPRYVLDTGSRSAAKYRARSLAFITLPCARRSATIFVAISPL